MIVRCGACSTQFDVAGPGRHRCPACGAVNQVGAAPPGTPPPADMPPGPPANARPATPSTRTACPDCGFDFYVGDIAMAICPNCRAEVAAGGGAPPPAVEEETP